MPLPDNYCQNIQFPEFKCSQLSQSQAATSHQYTMLSGFRLSSPHFLEEEPGNLYLSCPEQWADVISLWMYELESGFNHLSCGDNSRICGHSCDFPLEFNFLCFHLPLLITTWMSAATRDAGHWDRSILFLCLASYSSNTFPTAAEPWSWGQFLLKVHFHAAVWEASSLTSHLTHSSSAWGQGHELLPPSPFILHSCHSTHGYFDWTVLIHPVQWLFFFSKWRHPYFRNAFTLFLSACFKNTFLVSLLSSLLGSSLLKGGLHLLSTYNNLFIYGSFAFPPELIIYIQLSLLLGKVLLRT